MSKTVSQFRRDGNTLIDVILDRAEMQSGNYDRVAMIQQLRLIQERPQTNDQYMNNLIRAVSHSMEGMLSSPQYANSALLTPAQVRQIATNALQDTISRANTNRDNVITDEEITAVAFSASLSKSAPSRH